MRTLVEGCLIPVIALFGMLGNLASITVLRSTNLEMKKNFRQLLVSLAVYDLLFLLGATVAFSLPVLNTWWREMCHPFLFPWLLPFIQISLNGSTWSTVSVALERYTSVVHNNTGLSWLSSRFYIIPTLLLSLLWNIPRFNELSTCLDSNMTVSVSPFHNRSLSAVDSYVICPTEMRRSPSYIRDYILLANFLVMMLVPFLILVLSNTWIYRTVRFSSRSSNNRDTRSRAKRDQRLAVILIGIVILFGCCNIFKVIINSYEVVELVLHGTVNSEWPKWCVQLSLVSHLMLVVNSSANIIIYGWKDPKFRKVLFKLLHLPQQSPGGRPRLPNVPTATSFVNMSNQRSLRIHNSGIQDDTNTNQKIPECITQQTMIEEGTGYLTRFPEDTNKDTWTQESTKNDTKMKEYPNNDTRIHEDTNKDTRTYDRKNEDTTKEQADQLKINVNCLETNM